MKIICAMLAAGLVVLATGLYFCYERVISVENENTILKKELADIGSALEAQVQRGNAIAAATEKLQENDRARQEESVVFVRTLARLKQSNAAVRTALSALVPRAALSGLYSFGAGTGD